MNDTSIHSRHVARIVAAARAWVGTPYHYQSSIRGVACDCVGLVRGVWRAVVGEEPEKVPHYTRDWGEGDGIEHVLGMAGRHLLPAATPGESGNVVALRTPGRRIVKHCAILTGPNSMVHAVQGSGVVETNVGFWRSRIAGEFSFPRKG